MVQRWQPRIVMGGKFEKKADAAEEPEGRSSSVRAGKDTIYRLNLMKAILGKKNQEQVLEWFLALDIPEIREMRRLEARLRKERQREKEG